MREYPSILIFLYFDFLFWYFGSFDIFRCLLSIIFWALNYTLKSWYTFFLSHSIFCKSVPEEGLYLRHQSIWSESWVAGSGHRQGRDPPAACFPKITTWPKGKHTSKFLMKTDFKIVVIRPYFACIIDVWKRDIGDRKLKKFAEGGPALLHVKYKELLGWNQSSHL